MATITGTTGDDSLTGDTTLTGTFNDSISAGTGNDTLVGLTANDTLNGEDGNDVLEGGSGNDRLFGGLGDDYLYAGTFVGPDSDSLNGGDGNDTVDFSLGDQAITVSLGTGGNATVNPANDGNADRDTLTGIEHIVGTIYADSITVTNGNTSANIFYGGTGIDTLSGGTGADTLFGGTDGDSLSGGNDADVLYGGTGVDTLFGGAANDTLFGGADADAIDGDAGTDTASYIDSGSGVSVTLGGSGSGGDAEGDTLVDVENLIGSNFDDVLVGDAANNVLTGGTGADTLNGGLGDDTLYGGSERDTASFAGSSTAVNASLVTETATGQGSDSLSGIQNLIGSSGDDTLTGDDFANELTGGAGDDSISAGGSGMDVFDTIYGGTGNDTIDAGTGDDLVYGGPDSITSTDYEALDFNWTLAGADEADLSGGVSQDTGGINVSVSYTEGVAGSTFSVESSGTGTAADAPIYVDTAAGETFNANSSAELARPGGSTSTPASIDINFSAVAGSGFADEVRNVAFRVSDIDVGSFIDTVTVRAYDASGAEISVSLIEVQADLSTVGNTVTAVGAGTSPNSVTGSVLVNVEGPVARIELAYSDNGNSFQYIRVSDIQFSGVPETDSDSLIGSTGNDTMFGGAGDDTLLGQADNDQLYGGLGNDSIDAGDGNDTLSGGDGTDTLVGGAGNDVFVIATNDILETGNDIIDGGGNSGEAITTDYDTIDFSAYGWDRVEISYTSTDPLNLVGTITIYDAAGEAGGVIIGQIDFNEIEKLICFTPGTLVLTDRGEVAVERLVPGDKVVTRDRGLQELRWVGRRELSMLDLLAQPELQPVRIAKGAFGTLGPDRAMMVSPQHRVLIEGARAELLFGEAEVLVPAKHLVGQIEATRVLPEGGVSYIHLLFDAHEIVCSDGIWTESFQPAERTLSGLDAEARAEVLALFPELAVDADSYVGARLSLKAHEALVLFAA